MSSTTPGLKRRGSFVVRGSLALMVALFLVAAGVRMSHHHTTSVVHATGSVYEFYASPQQVSCEFDTETGSTQHSIYCEYASSTFAQHVVMTSTGHITVCRSINCGSNAGLGTPTFLAPTHVVGAPITCVVLSHGTTCTLPSGRGFTITPTTITELS